MREPTDSDLWARATAGDAEAFGTLYERHAGAIYNYLFRRLADFSQAEDLTAVVFLEAYRRRNDVVIEDGKVLPWLYGVATNLLRNRRRAISRHRRTLERLPRPRPAPDLADDAAARLDAQRKMASLLRLIRALPREQQEVLALCAWSGLTYEEAAVALDVPVGTIRSRLSRARASLRELEPGGRHETDVTYAKERTAER